MVAYVYYSLKIEYYEDDPDLPIFERISPNRKQLYSVEDIVHILLHPDIHSSPVTCKKVPTSICESVSFIISFNSLDNKDDILSDDLGVWKNNGIDTTCVKVKRSHSSKEVTYVEKCNSSAAVHSVKRVYRIHGTDNSLKKITAYIYGMSILNR